MLMIFSFYALISCVIGFTAGKMLPDPQFYPVYFIAVPSVICIMISFYISSIKDHFKALHDKWELMRQLNEATSLLRRLVIWEQQPQRMMPEIKDYLKKYTDD